jgi:hypothetical protein
LDSLLASAKYEQLNQLLQPLQNLARMPPVEEDGGADDEAQEAAPGPVLPPRPRQRAVQGAVKGLVGVDGNAAQIEELDKISSEMLPTARSLFFTDGKFLKTPDGSKHFVLELAQKMHSEFIGGVYKLERTGLAVTWTSRRRLGHRTRASLGRAVVHPESELPHHPRQALRDRRLPQVVQVRAHRGGRACRAADTRVRRS